MEEIKNITGEYKIVPEENVLLPRYDIIVSVEVPEDDWGNEYTTTVTYKKEEFESNNFLAIVLSYAKKYSYENFYELGKIGRQLRVWLYNNGFFTNNDDTTLCDLDIWYFDEENRRFKVTIPELDDYFDDPSSWDVTDDDDDEEEPEDSDFQKWFYGELEKQNRES